MPKGPKKILKPDAERVAQRSIGMQKMLWEEIDQYAKANGYTLHSFLREAARRMLSTEK